MSSSASGVVLSTQGKRTLLLVLGAVCVLVLVWRAIMLSMSQYYADELYGSPDPDAALYWNSENPWALYLRGKLEWQSNPSQALVDIRKALAANPANGRAAVAYALLRQQLAANERADEAVVFAARAMPGFADIRLQAAYYWLTQGQFVRGIENWSAALQARPSLRKDIFPALTEILEGRDGIRYVSTLMADLPSWWQEFFSYVITNATRPETVAQLYALRRQAQQPVSREERHAYTRWLISENRWSDAYVNWVNGLDLNRQRHIGQPFNGSFEFPFQVGGFNWQTATHRGLSVDAVPTFDAVGSKALRLQFKDKLLRFDYLRQLLMLMPGTYRLYGRVHSDGLHATKGLQWTLGCARHDSATLGASERFVGTRPWQAFRFQFTVPDEGCAGQVLTLHASGRQREDFRVQGTIWFDNLRIVRL